MLGLQLCLSFVPPQKAPGGWRERETLHETNWPLAAWAIGGGAQQREGSAMPQGHCAELLHNDWQNNMQRFKHHGIIVKLRGLLSPALLSLRLPSTTLPFSLPTVTKFLISNVRNPPPQDFQHLLPPNYHISITIITLIVLSLSCRLIVA